MQLFSRLNKKWTGLSPVNKTIVKLVLIFLLLIAIPLTVNQSRIIQNLKQNAAAGDCNNGLTCTACVANSNSCSFGNGKQDCTYTTSLNGGTCKPVTFPAVYCYQPNCSAGFTCNSSQTCVASASTVTLDLYPEHYSIVKNPNLWKEQLNATYALYKDLTGQVPFNGDVITIKEVPVAQMTYGGNVAGMLSGNPILWNDQTVVGALNSINDNKDLSFGPIHELGHDFDIYFQSSNYLSGDLNLLSVEQWANFKAAYVIDSLAKTYPNSTVYQPSAGYFPAEKFSHDYFYAKANAWLGSGKDWTQMNNDEYTGFLYHLTEKYGWDPFKKTFRDYNSVAVLGNVQPSTDLGKIKLFANTLAKYAGSGVLQDFKDWRFPL